MRGTGLKLRAGLMAVATAVICSCEHKDLCFDHPGHVPRLQIIVEAEYEREWQYTYEGGTDWAAYPAWPEAFGMSYDDLRPSLPGGLRVMIYNADGSNNIVNTAPEGGNVDMREGEHPLLFYNNDTEYIVFDDMQSYVLARATTRSRARSSYMGNPYQENRAERTVNQPDMLYGCYMESYTARRTEEPDVISVMMHPLTFTYLIRYEFSHGLNYVAMARGALAGMAESVFLNSGRTSDGEATVLFDCTLHESWAQARVRTFGVAGFENGRYTRAERRYALNLELRLTNGALKTLDFDVTDQLESQPQGGVIVVRGIEVSDDEGMKGGSGFDVDVGGWGDYEDIELPF